MKNAAMFEFEFDVATSVLITARMQFQKHSVTRRCWMPRDKPSFSDLLEAVEKLFGGGIKACPTSCYYIDQSGDHVTFSSDEELAIGFFMAGKELKIVLEEMTSVDSILKVENPSTDSSAISSSLESSPSQHSTPNQLPAPEKGGNQRNEVVTPTLYRSKIVPKMKGQHALNVYSCLNSCTFTKDERDVDIARVSLPKRKKDGGDGIICCSSGSGEDLANGNADRSRNNHGDEMGYYVDKEDPRMWQPCSVTVQNGSEQSNKGLVKRLTQAMKYLSVLLLPFILGELH